jgi:ABC-type multidrug transport system ATPase subunit
MLNRIFTPQVSLTSRHRVALSLENVSVQFGTFKALKNINLQLAVKEMLFVTGPSGAGKTTLLNVMAQLLNPTSGDFRTLASADFFVATVFQDLRLQNSLSCEDNLWVSYDPQIYHSKNEFQKDLQEYARYLGIYDSLHKKIHEANGGLKSKVALLRALLSKPQLLLADELSAALDREASFKLYELLSHFNQKKDLTVVWASHHKELVKQFSGRVAHIEQGRLVYSGQACFI